MAHFPSAFTVTRRASEYSRNTASENPTLLRPKVRLRAWAFVPRLLASDRGAGLLLFAVVYALLLLVGLRTAWGADVPRELLGLAGLLPLSLVSVVLASRAARNPAISAEARKAWWLIAGAQLSLAAAFAAGAYKPIFAEDPRGLVAGIFSLIFYPLFLWGLLSFPGEHGSSRRKRVYWLDTGTAVLAGAIVFWYVVPALALAPQPLAARLLYVGVAVGDFLLLFGIASILFRRSHANLLFGLRLLALAVVSVWIAQIGEGLAQGRGTFEESGWLLAVRIAQALLVAVAAQAMIAQPGLPRSIRAVAQRASDRGFAVPLSSYSYLGIAIGYAAMLYAASAAGSRELQAMVAVGGALIILMVIRQSIVIRDTERARESIKASEERFRALVQYASDVVTVVDAAGVVGYQGPSAERVLGRAPLPPGSSLEEDVHPDDRNVFKETLHQALKARGVPVRREWRSRHASGAWLHMENVATNLIGDGVIDGIVLNSSDLTERKALEEELTHRAFHDPLTGLANRALFSNILDLALIRARRSGKGTAVLFLDLDNFKTVNDVLGHSAGDSVLVEVADRLRREVRVSDTVARLGGDEFAVLLDEMSQPGDAVPVTSRILGGLQIEVPSADGGHIVVTASIGLAIATGVESREEMLRRADSAMYEAKRAGGNRLVDYAQMGGSDGAAALLSEADLRRALELGEFAIRYQPIRAVEGGKITAVAAEVRWFHPRQGLLPPEEFVALAERTGLDIPLGYHVIEESCRQVGAWQRRFPSSAPLGLALQVRRRQLEDPAFPENVRSLLMRTGMAGGSLVLEITEADLLESGDGILKRLHPLRDNGVKIGVTEFGSGCRVLNALDGFPLDVMRLDRSLVRDLKQGNRLAAGAVLNVGRALSVQTLAAGVTDSHVLAALRELGCELAQGEFVGASVSKDQLEELLREGGTPRLSAAS